MRGIKLILTLILALVVSLQTALLAYLLAISSELKWSINNTLLATILLLPFSFYLLVLTFLSISQNTIATHWPTIIHLSALGGLATLFLGISALVPSSSSSLSSPPILALQYTSLALYTISTWLFVTTPRGPKVYFSPLRLYSAKTLSSTATTLPSQVTAYEQQAITGNVTEVVNATVLDYLLFSYITPVVLLGYKSDSVEIRDLPIVPADMRAGTLFMQIRNALRDPKIKLRKKWEENGKGWGLMWKIVVVNKTILITQLTIAAVTATVYYAPAYFLQNFVKSLEDDPERLDVKWSWVCVFFPSVPANFSTLNFLVKLLRRPLSLPRNPKS